MIYLYACLLVAFITGYAFGRYWKSDDNKVERFEWNDKYYD